MVCRDRKELTAQTVWSMVRNAADWNRHRLLIVIDYSNDAWAWTYDIECELRRTGIENVHRIHAGQTQLGVGGAKNYGAAWYRSGLSGDASSRRPSPEGSGLLMFSDNDMWYGPGWDTRLETAYAGTSTAQIVQLGGWRHLFHKLGFRVDKLDPHIGRTYEVDAVTGNCFVIRWSDWLKYGPFDSNAIGPGQSEDYALSQRIRAGGGLVATLDPPVAIHCGLVNSIGEPATGWRECEEQITEQLAGLSAEMQESVLIMRPAPTAEPKTSWNSELYSTFGKLRVGPDTKLPDGRTVAEAGLEPGPIVASRYAPGGESLEDIAARLTARVLAHVNGRAASVFEQARKGLDMQPREATADQGGTTLTDINERWNRAVERIVTAPRQLIAGLNLCSGQRRFDPALGWANLDGQRVPPDRVPDIVWQADEPLPFGDATMSYVAIVHALEHFGCGESVPLLRECHRVLRPGGSLIVVVPDMKRLAARWLSGEISEYIFNVNCYGAYISDERDRHRWSISRESLPNLLGEAGTWSKITEFDYREIAGSDFPRDWWMLAMEAVK